MGLLMSKWSLNIQKCEKDEDIPRSILQQALHRVTKYFLIRIASRQPFRPAINIFLSSVEARGKS